PGPGFKLRPSVRLEPIAAESLPEPQRRTGEQVNILMTGVGGTGVVTVNQVLSVAARLDGFYSAGLDQTGLAQKGGSVVSHLKLAPAPLMVSNLIGTAEADVLLAFDLLAAADDRHIRRNSSE